MSGINGYYVFLKLSSHESGDNLNTNVIPLRVVSVSCSVNKAIPSVPIPLSTITGESTTAALDIGAATKSISLQGFIVSGNISKEFSDGTSKNLNFTAHEIAQMIASGVDSTGLALQQSFNELVVLIPSNVDSNYVSRDDASGIGSLGDLIPFTFTSRGSANSLDNEGVILPNSFPDTSTSKGVEGFVRSFSFDLSAETVEISFSMDFEVASVFPKGNPFV